MFPAEPEGRQRDTGAEEARRRAREGRDRKGLKHVVVAMAIIFGGLAALIGAEAARLERRLTVATVVGFVDRWNMKGGHECVTQLTTGYGDAEVYSRNLCHDTPWHIGDTAEVEARQLRLSGAIVVSTRGTIFRGAYGGLPE